MSEQFAERAAEAGFVVHRGSVPSFEAAEISHAAIRHADTGYDVLLSSDEPRSRSQMPRKHVTVVREDTILTGLEELFERLGPTCRAP